MVRRHLYDNIISTIGAWLLLILTLGLFYLVFAICEYYHMKKYCYMNKRDFKKVLKEVFHELKYSYWKNHR